MESQDWLPLQQRRAIIKQDLNCRFLLLDKIVTQELRVSYENLPAMSNPYNTRNSNNVQFQIRLFPLRPSVEVKSVGTRTTELFVSAC